jgi:hypothetical protein
MKKFLVLAMVLLFASSAFAAGTLTVAKSASIANPIKSTNFTYYIQVTCTGNCYGVQVVDTLPTGFALIGFQPTGTLTSNIIQWFCGDAAYSMTNTSQTFTFYGNLPSYTILNITNTAECFGSQGGDVSSTTILAMATPTVPTPTFTSTVTPNYTSTANATKTMIIQATGTAYMATQTAKITNYLATQTAIYAVGTSIQQTRTSIVQTKTAVAALTQTKAATQTMIVLASQTITATPTTQVTAVVCGTGYQVLSYGPSSVAKFSNLYNANAGSVTWVYTVMDANNTISAAAVPAKITVTANTGNYGQEPILGIFTRNFNFGTGVVINASTNTVCVQLTQ